MADHMRAELVNQALAMALSQRQPAADSSCIPIAAVSMAPTAIGDS